VIVRSVRVSCSESVHAESTRLTNGFSKKLENYIAANALYFPALQLKSAAFLDTRAKLAA
jgi:hypothetical protein